MKKDESIKEENKVKEQNCNCKNNDCKCQEGEPCTCGDNCTCGEECTCGCKDGNCTCGDDCKCHEEEINKMQEKVKDLEEKIKLSQAELINYRKRKDEEVAGMLKYANQDLILELLPVVDNFERAMTLADKSNAELTKFLNGFNMLYIAIKDIFTKFGVEEISEVGVMFDPAKHQALLVEEDKDKENDVVLEILLKGYILKGRVIRPASVKVNKIN